MRGHPCTNISAGINEHHVGSKTLMQRNIFAQPLLVHHVSGLLWEGRGEITKKKKNEVKQSDQSPLHSI